MNLVKRSLKHYHILLKHQLLLQLLLRLIIATFLSLGPRFLSQAT